MLVEAAGSRFFLKEFIVKKNKLLSLFICVISLVACNDTVSQAPQKNKNSYVGSAEMKREIPKNVWKSLIASKEIFLISLDPMSEESDNKTPSNSSKIFFHGFEELGRTKIDNQIERTKIAEEIKASISDVSASQADCFWPRHAILVADGKLGFEILICYECHGVEIYEGNKQIFYESFGGTSTYFNELLKKANLPLAPN
jgi:hypothetical protein